MVTRDDLGAELENIASWPNQNIPGAIQRMGGAKDEVGVVQITDEVLDHRNTKICSIGAGRRYDQDERRLCGRVRPNK